MLSRTMVAFALLAVMPLHSSGQEQSSLVAPVNQKNIRYVQLELESVQEVPFVASPFITAPIICSADGQIFVRMADSSGIADLISISSDAKYVTRFSINKVNDVLNPSQISFFVTSAGVYLLLRGVELQGKTLEFQRPDGSVQKQEAVVTRQFIARFGMDGTYLGAVALDIPFRPLQIGVFRSGDFLIAGTTKDMQEVRIALVKSNGQFQRFVEAKDDISLSSGPNDEERDGSLPRAGKRFGQGFFGATQLSSIVGDGPNLLLIRKGQKTPVFSISPGGDVKAMRPDVPDGYVLWDLRATRQEWIALYSRRISDTAGVEFASMAIDPKTGQALEAYTYTRLLGFGLACTDGLEFSFLTREDNKLKIVKLISSHRSSSGKEKTPDPLPPR